jgi:cation transporter-like permease
MIYPLGGLLIGALAGALMARRKGGGRLDMLQWAAVLAIILGVLGMFVTVGITRAAV